MTGGEARAMRAIAALMAAAAALTLAGCGGQRPPLETITVPLPANVEAEKAPEAPPLPVLEPVPPELVTASRAEDLWHLRSALNVAALICDPKVHTGLIPAYNRLLREHKSLLTAAVQTELDQFRKVDGKKWQAMYDTHMTKLYNTYSLTQQRDKFCVRSADTASLAADLTDEALSAQATAMIFRINMAGDIK
ncbi:MAG: hypothetical protein J7494_11350 [Sphingobium sp.]|nr:hypothetical protein [Sphingobium sp.]